MRVVEQFIQSKTKNFAECEDGIFVSDQYIAIVDGATSKSPRLWEGRKSGLVAKEILLERLTALAPNLDAGAACAELNAAIKSWYAKEHVEELMQQHPVERLSASTVIYSVAKKEIWMVGDCQALLDTESITNEKRIDAVENDARAAFLEAEIIAGKTIEELREHDAGRAFILPLLERQNNFQNRFDTPYGYPVLDGFFDGQHLKIVPAQNAASIVLASDGYPFLKQSLAESESALEALLVSDPLLFRVRKSPKAFLPGNNSYDDRAYIRFTV